MFIVMRQVYGARKLLTVRSACIHVRQGRGHLVSITHGEDAHERLDAKRAKRAGAVVCMHVKEGRHRVDHCLNSIVEHL